MDLELKNTWLDVHLMMEELTYMETVLKQHERVITRIELSSCCPATKTTRRRRRHLEGGRGCRYTVKVLHKRAIIPYGNYRGI